MEGRLLSALYRRKGSVAATESLMVALYGQEPDVEPKIIDVFVCKARKKLGRSVSKSEFSARGLLSRQRGRLARLRRALSGDDPAGDAERALKERIAELQTEKQGLAATLAALRAPSKW